MRYCGSPSLLAFGLFALASPASAAAPLPRVIDYNRDVRPILADNCFKCHGPDSNQRKGDLRLDTKEGLFRKRLGGPPVSPGKPEKSELYRRLTTTDADEHMPQAESGKSLTERQIAVIKKWIEQGAEYKGHWAYLAPTRPEPPDVKDAFVRNPIDRFILVRLRDEDLKPSPEADRVTLIRRLSFDLTGLPPTPEEVEAFVNDERPDAYEKLIDKLLASPHHGERMAVYWLDLVRYADSIGYHSDNPMNVSPYRDYVIRAFNDNKKFDAFTVEQLAGDLLPDATLEQKVATAYNRLLQTTEEGGAQAKEYEAKYAADRVRNVSSVWLGATMGCCQCHDHKFDPYTLKDFYRFAAFFADVKEAAVGRRETGIPVPTRQQAAEIRKLDEALVDFKAAYKRGMEPDPAPARAGIAAAAKRKADLLKAVPTCLTASAGPPRTVRVLPRGNWLDDKGDVVLPGVPQSMPQATAKGDRATRLDLARWIVARDNPLTARVFVNRLWKLYFGQGLAKTLDDLGSQGEAPTHPELLDWLAVEFIESGWDVRHTIKLIVLSGTYRQDSRMRPELKERDPFNRLYARQSRWRLEAEMVRDNALAVSGLLNRQIGGPSVKPYQPAGYWSALNFPPREWQNDGGEALYRRGLYTHWQRSFLHPSLLAFDAPSREECCVERTRSNIPQQALVLLNDPTYVEAARAFAERILQEGGKTPEERLTFAFAAALSRKPKAEEVKVLAALVEKHVGEFAEDKAAALKLLGTGAHPMRKDVDVVELAAWTSAARVILNLHEAITRD